MRLPLAFALCASPALADYGRHTWNTSALSELRMIASDEPNCPFEIIIDNRMSDYKDEMRGELELDGHIVAVHYLLNVDALGAEEYRFIPPNGFIAIPQDIIVPDDQTASVMICEWVGL